MKKLIPHIILIPLLLVIPIVTSPDFDGTLSVFRVQPFQREFIRFVLIIIFFYLNLYWLLPKFFGKKKYIEFSLSTVVCFGLMMFLPYYLSEKNLFSSTFAPQPPKEMLHGEMQPPPHGNMPPPAPNMPRNGAFQQPQPPNQSSYPQMIFSSFLPFLFSFLASFFIFRNNEKKELERLKAKAELLNLKYQLQPHFLFNILNSIYSLTLLKSDDAPNGILKLSNVMRYVVQESSKDFVDLEKEIAYLKDYIALQLIRTDTSLDFSYTEIGDLKGWKISPFILVNFVENAFKYGFNAEEDSKISVSVIVQEGVLEFQVFNRIVIHKITDEESLKVGLKNTIEHLKSVYAEKQTLNITHTNENYQVDLKLNLF